MNVAIICNSYPTKNFPRNQVFIKKLENEFVCQGINIRTCYNKIFDIWGSANKSKDIFSNIIKYTVYTFSVIVFFLKNYKSIDILFPQGIVFTTFTAVLIKKIINVPVVCYIHGEDLNIYYNKKGIMNSILRYSLNQSDYIVANSRDIYDKARKVSSNPNITIISPGVDLKIMRKLDGISHLKKKLNIPENKLLFMGAGTAIERKGFDVFLDALLQLDSKIRKKIYVFLLTDGPKKQSYIDFINQNNLQNIISVRDRVNHDILNQYYNSADYFVFPSRNEPLGLVGLEAMVSNTIVIGSKVGGIKEYVIPQKTGFLFEKNNSEELATCIEKIVQNENGYTHFYPEMEKMVKSHSLENSVVELTKLFQQIISKDN